MRRLIHVPILALVLAVPSLLLAAPPEVPREVKAQPGQPVRVLVKGGELGFKATFADDEAFFDELAAKDGQRRFMFQANKPGRYAVVFWTKGETDGAVTTIIVGDAAPDPTPPGPNPPGPTPPPAPGALKTFRVILVSETGTTLTAAQYAVLYAKAVGDWLDANTTRDGDGALGWRRYDKDARTDGDRPAFNAMWAEAKPKAGHGTVVVERNGKVAIVPFEASPAAMIATLTKLREGK